MSGEQQGGSWQLPKFRFAVDIDGVAAGLAFQEVSGLGVEGQPIEYRAGDNPVFSTVKPPGIRSSSSITLKKGVFAGDRRLLEWFAQTGRTAGRRSAVTIRLLDEGGTTVMVWTVASAWPMKITATELAAQGNEVAIETLELAHEGLTIASS